MFLVYGGEEELVVRGYTDASFQTDKDDSKSQTGYVFSLNGGAVSWKSSKQETVADSTTEAEYIAASNAAKEAVWIKKFVTEFAVVPSIADPVDLYCDNNGAIAQAKEPRDIEDNGLYYMGRGDQRRSGARERERVCQGIDELAGLIKCEGVFMWERGHNRLMMPGGAVGYCWEACRLGCKLVQRSKGT
ncbi:hypothetical protein CRG98_001154 [Punica granatum]|uniref:Retrotransposon protein, putative, Ty1-copia subclass n=1 Tax=Punica granatum TaxID=22663 RepID=A0A2I0LCP2_PUNGR|nr:hypothetical protein CRG98_001154 [Punica granatum]